MSKSNSRILSQGTSLFRYNIGIDLPVIWDDTYHSPEYANTIYGPKNQIGAFFFYEQETTARAVLEIARGNLKGDEDINTNSSITYCHLMTDVKLLDISGWAYPMQVLRVLIEEGIDVLTNDFVKHDGKDCPFSELKADYDFVISNEEVGLCSKEGKKIMRAADRINKFFHKEVETRYIGQLLTDFENGKSFKAQLMVKGFDGYCFTEEVSPTICIFDSSKLSKPIHKVI